MLPKFLVNPQLEKLFADLLLEKYNTFIVRCVFKHILFNLPIPQIVLF